MNLTADEYLTIVDQMTLLRLQNQRYVQDNSILAQKVQQQNILFMKQKQQSCVSNIHFGTSYSSAYQPEVSHLGYDIHRPLAQPLNHQLQKSQSMKTFHENELLQRQIQNLRNEINSLKSLKKANCQQKINPTQKKIDKNFKKAPFPSKSKEGKQLFENSKLLYSIEKNCKSELSIDQISHWICGKQLKRNETQMQDEFNPIKTVKQAQRQKILQQLTNKTFNLPTKKKPMNTKNCASQNKAFQSQQSLKSAKSIKGKQNFKTGSMNQTKNFQNLKLMNKCKSKSKNMTRTGQRDQLKRDGSSSKINSSCKKLKSQY